MRFSGEQRKTRGDQFTNITFQKLTSMYIFIQTKSHLFQKMFNAGEKKEKSALSDFETVDYLSFLRNF